MDRNFMQLTNNLNSCESLVIMCSNKEMDC